MPPAARQGDLTVHGGTLAAGCASVLINGQPAVRQGDAHLCPLCNPGTPPPPHVGGPVLAGSTTVQIGGMPAARQGDACTCQGPPDAVAVGSPDVMIGDAVSNASAPGAAGAKSGRLARTSAAAFEALPPEVGSAERFELAAQFVDPAGRPVSAVPYVIEGGAGDPGADLLPGSGTVHRAARSAADDGEVRIAAILGAWWSADEVRPGETVVLTAETVGIDDGTPVRIALQCLDEGGGTGAQTIEAQVDSARIEVEWTCTGPEPVEAESGASRPLRAFVAVVSTEGCHLPTRTPPLTVSGRRLAPVVSADPIPAGTPLPLLMSG